jgi:hypothetical protein
MLRLVIKLIDLLQNVLRTRVIKCVNKTGKLKKVPGLLPEHWFGSHLPALSFVAN